MGAIERASSFSCSSSPRKGRQHSSCQKDKNGLLKEKLLRKASSFSSPSPLRKEERKEKEKKQSGSCQKESREVQKGKLIQRSSSLSSSSSSLTKKEKLVSKEKRDEPRKSSSFKSRIRELGPICKRRKETLAEVPVKIQVEDDVDICLDKQIKDEGKDNPDGCLWLSSGSMTPEEFGLFMSALDPSLDEWIVSFLPKSSPKIPVYFDGSSATPTEEDQAVIKKEEVANEAKESSSSFWNMDRTGVWVSLINLDGEDSKWLSEVDSSKEMESNFPSPNYEINWDSYSSDVGFTSSGRSTQETSHSEWSSDLLSDSMDWELDSDDPIFWPFGMDVNWDDQGGDSFSVSPRKGVCKINFESIKGGSVPPGSIKLRLHARKPNSKEASKRRILLLSGLSASKIIEFKRGRGSRYSKISKRGARFKRRVPPILENVLEEGKSPKETPKKVKLSSSDMFSEDTDNWDDEMDTEGPLFWPSDQKCAWDSTWDCFNVSPRKGSKPAGSPKGGFSVSSSVRLRFRPRKKTQKISDLCASKSFKFKSRAHKSKVTAASAGGKSSSGIMVILPSSVASRLNKPAEFKPGSCRKRIRAMPLRSVEELMRLVSVMGKDQKFCDAEFTSEDLPIEIMVGLDEFDGHEGIDPEFEEENFSLEECIKE